MQQDTWYSELEQVLINLGMQKSDRDYHFSHYDLFDSNKKLGVKFYSLVDNSSLSPEFETIPKSAHFDAYKRALSDGVHLVSIFEHDWLKKKDKIISYFNDVYNSKPLYARKLTLSTVPSKQKREFINRYHLSGDSSQGSIAYGLYTDTELVSVMTFGKLRGQTHVQYEKSFELSRFVTASGYRVIGGASRLFSAFIRDYDPEYICCYSDNDFYTGQTYDKLGFKFVEDGHKAIDYNWVRYNEDYTDIEVLSRQQCQPWRLRTKYPEILGHFTEGSQEDFCMLSLGFSKFYRASNARREWLKSI